jgi:hypothetical protein
MEVPQPAAFLGLTFDVWVGIFMAALAAYAAIVLARRKRQSFASLGDHEPYEEPGAEAPGHPAATANDPDTREPAPTMKSRRSPTPRQGPRGKG